DPGRIRTCDRLISLPTTAFAAPDDQCQDLWSGLSLRHFRRATYSLYGTLRKSSAQCTPLDWLFRGIPTLSETDWEK
ncbi:hypothetical protein, partial [Phaeodactylibacter xiamenensis]|uniref:hypothetical protein n=1 Tax=Phaeodactylibacter xiamenensis TaxID=1524460 RepID=UPI0024A939E8